MLTIQKVAEVFGVTVAQVRAAIKRAGVGPAATSSNGAHLFDSSVMAEIEKALRG